MDNVININDTKIKGDSMPDNEVQIQEFDDDPEEMDLDEYFGFMRWCHKGEMVKTLNKIDRKVDDHEMDLLETIYDFELENKVVYGAFEKLFSNISIEEVNTFDTSFWENNHLRYLIVRFNSYVRPATSGHTFIVKLFGEFVHSVIERPPTHITGCRDHLDIDIDEWLTANLEWKNSLKS